VDEENPNLLLYQATLDNVFNKPDESNRLIDVLLGKYSNSFYDTIMKELHYMKSANAYRLQDYRTAYEEDSAIVNRYGRVCDSSEIDTRQDDISVFQNLSNAPKMEITIPADSKVPLKRDLAGLFTVSVACERTRWTSYSTRSRLFGDHGIAGQEIRSQDHRR